MNPTSQERAGNRATGRMNEPSTTETSSTSATDQVRRDAAQVGGQVKQRGQELASEAQHQMEEAKRAAKQTVREATEKAKTTGRDYAVKKKQLVSDELKVFSDAIQRAADTLRQEEHQGVATYASALAEQLDSVREGLERRNVSELLREAQNFTRRRPEIVYGGLFVAGLAMMRFLKASNRDHRDELDPMGQTRMGGRPRNASMGTAPSRPVSTVHGSNLAGDTRLVVSQDETLRVDSAMNRGGSASNDGQFPRSTGASGSRSADVTGNNLGTGSTSIPGTGSTVGTNRSASQSNPTSGSGVNSPNGPAPGTRPGLKP